MRTDRDDGKAITRPPLRLLWFMFTLVYVVLPLLRPSFVALPSLHFGRYHLSTLYFVEQSERQRTHHEGGRRKGGENTETKSDSHSGCMHK